MFWAGSYAQIDESDNSLPNGEIEKESSPEPDRGDFHIDKAPSFDDDSKRMLGQPDKLSLDTEDEDDEKVEMRQKEKYVKRESDVKNKRREEERENRVPDDVGGDQNLGEYTTTGKFVKVSWRDAQVVDGDRVDVLVNGKVEVKNTTLLGHYQSLYIDLNEEGFTKIEFEALNQGDSGPNTADFKVEDEEGKVLKHDEWNLLTGDKASLVVIKN